MPNAAVSSDVRLRPNFLLGFNREPVLLHRDVLPGHRRRGRNDCRFLHRRPDLVPEQFGWVRLVPNGAVSDRLSVWPVLVSEFGDLQAKRRYELLGQRNNRLRIGSNVLLGFNRPSVLLHRHNLPDDWRHRRANVVYVTSSFVHRVRRLQLVPEFALPADVSVRSVFMQRGVQTHQ